MKPIEFDGMIYCFFDTFSVSLVTELPPGYTIIIQSGPNKGVKSIATHGFSIRFIHSDKYFAFHYLDEKICQEKRKLFIKLLMESCL